MARWRRGAENRGESCRRKVTTRHDLTSASLSTPALYPHKFPHIMQSKKPVSSQPLQFFPYLDRNKRLFVIDVN